MHTITVPINQQMIRNMRLLERWSAAMLEAEKATCVSPEAKKANRKLLICPSLPIKVVSEQNLF